MKARTVAKTLGGVAVLGVLFCIWLMWEPAIAPVKPSMPADKAAVARGRMVLEAGDCAVCHTAPGGKYLAGSLPLKTPFGTLYTTNITPDSETGIGQWSEAAFSRAMRNGVARDGRLLYPAFPYVHYRKMSDHDISDLYAYLMSVDPVSQTPPPNRMMFPMNFRPLVAFWNLLFRHGDPLEDRPGQSVQWNRGRYLVEGPGHCSSCHTPLNFIGAEKGGSDHFAGSIIDGWTAPPLAGLSTAINPWTQGELVAYLRGEVAPNHGAAAGPMLPVTHGMATMPLADVQAMATYLLSFAEAQPVAGACKNPSFGALQPASQLSQIEQQGAALFAGSCSGCHGDAATMRRLDDRPDLGHSSALLAGTPRNLVKAVLEGIPMSVGAPSHYMPPFADNLSDQQIAAIAQYLRGQYCPSQPWGNLSQTVTQIRQEEK